MNINKPNRGVLTEKYVLSKIFNIERQLEGSNRPAATRTLAILRRGAGHPPGRIADAWVYAFDNCPEQLLGDEGYISDEERTIYLMLTLYALHRQGQQKPMHAEGGLSLGSAMYAVAQTGGDLSPSMPSAFKSLMNATSAEEIGYYLRQCITRIKGQQIVLDYKKLTRQMLAFQNPYQRDFVRLQWSRDYAYALGQANRTKENKQDEETT